VGSLVEHNLPRYSHLHIVNNTLQVVGLGQGGLRQSFTLQSSLHALQQSHHTIGSGQNVSGDSVESSQGGGGVGRVRNGGKVTSGLTGLSPCISEGEQVRQHLS